MSHLEGQSDGPRMLVLERISQMDTGENLGGGKHGWGVGSEKEKVSPETGFPERTPHGPT